jgi:hypothetical protein
MKICVCLRGKHYETDYVDYRKSFENYKEFIINPFIQKGDSVDVFVATYDSKISSELLLDYSPKKYIFLNENIQEHKGTNTNNRQCDFHIMLMDMLKYYDVTYDLIIDLRFDLFFKVKITDMNIDYEKINIAFQHTSGNCDDNMFVIKSRHIDILKNGFRSLKDAGGITHQINSYLPTETIHYMIDYRIGDISKTQWTYWNIMRNDGIQT